MNPLFFMGWGIIHVHLVLELVSLRLCTWDEVSSRVCCSVDSCNFVSSLIISSVTRSSADVVLSISFLTPFVFEVAEWMEVAGVVAIPGDDSRDSRTSFDDSVFEVDVGL